MPATKPICFMVMPFGIKDVPAGTARAPARVNFDRLWSAALQPVIESLGYEAVRADQEVGALIIHEMLERLYFADLVVADMSIPNANVYYEIGVRHAARPSGCVLVSADWAQPMFDVQQMRRLLYPLPQEHLSDKQAQAVQAELLAGIEQMRTGSSPMLQALPGYPNPSPDRALTLRQELAALARFQQELEAVALAGDEAAVRERAMAIALANPAPEQHGVSTALPLVRMLRDHAGWDAMLAYVEALPPALRELPVMQEQRALALSKHKGGHMEAIAALRTLVKLQGETSERLGLIGGRYKRLADEAQGRGDARAHHQWLAQAIDHYERGRQLDLGGYYCACNLARLYRARGEDGDEQQAQAAQQLTVLMVESALARGTADEWARPTLLGAAFDAGDLAAARRAAAAVRREGAAAWKLATTLDDLRRSTAQRPAGADRQAFEAVLAALQDCLPAA